MTALLVLLGLVTASFFGRLEWERRRETKRLTTLGNVKDLSLALFEFDNEFGGSPDNDTLADVCAATGSAPWPLVTSNDYFRQIIAFKKTCPESIFSDGGAASWTRKPDEIKSPLSKALEGGECAWTYIPMSSSGEPSRPVLLYPVIPGTYRFDPKAMGGKAIVLRVDNSATPMRIEEDGRVLSGGMDIFDPANPIWGGMRPDVKWPAAK